MLVSQMTIKEVRGRFKNKDKRTGVLWRSPCFIRAVANHHGKPEIKEN